MKLAAVVLLLCMRPVNPLLWLVDSKATYVCTRYYMQDVAEALRRLPDDVIVARNARLRRAMDLSLKGTTLPQELQDKQTPFASYIQVGGHCWKDAGVQRTSLRV